MKIALFASGEGTNAENIIRYFSQSGEVVIPLVVINRKEAGARRRAESLGVTVEYIPKREWEDEGRVLSLLRSYGIEAIVLSGFLSARLASILHRESVHTQRGLLLY